MNKQKNSMNIPFRIIKIADIIYTTAVCLTITVLTLKLLHIFLFPWVNKKIDKITNEYYSTQNQIVLYGLLLFLFSFHAVFNYLLRNIIEVIPSPLHNVQGYDHFRLKEIADVSSLIFTIFIMLSPIHVKIMNLVFLPR